MPVKIKPSLPSSDSSRNGSAPRFSGFWLIYFMATIAVMGLTVGYCAVIPLALIGRVYAPSARLGDFVLRVGIRYGLMRIQPWFKAEIDLPLESMGKKRAQLSVSNHRSHIEAFIILGHVEGVRILAKRALFMVPFLGTYMRLTKQIPVSKGSFDGFFKAMDEVRERLKKGERVHVFPELSRAEAGSRGLRNFSVAPFRAAIQAGAEVQPIAFIHSDEVWPKGRFGVSFRRPMRAVALAPLSASDFTSAELLRDEVVRRIGEVVS